MKKNILLLHPIYTSLGIWEESLVNNFVYLGYNVYSIDYRKESYIYKFRSFFYEKKLLKIIEKYIKEIKPEFIFVSKGELITPFILQQLQKYKIPLINWIGDGPWIIDFIKSVYKYYDFFYTFDSKTIELLNNPSNVKYLSFGFDTLMDRTFVSNNMNYYKSDISFIGSPTTERLKLLKYLKNLNINIKIWGPRGWEKTKYKDFYMGKPLIGKEMYFAYKHSKIVINVHYGFGQKNVVPYNGINHRFFESFGIGTYCLSNYQSDMKKDFESDFIYYNSFNELKEKVIFCLENSDKINEITHSLQKEILSKHTLLKKLKIIINDFKNGS